MAVKLSELIKTKDVRFKPLGRLIKKYIDGKEFQRSELDLIEDFLMFLQEQELLKQQEQRQDRSH
jgi:hypothetical protein